MRNWIWKMLRSGRAGRLRPVLALAILALCSGCWDQAELTERGFVMGVALDASQEGETELTAQIYKPSPSAEGRPNTSFVNITTSEENLFDAVRDIPIQLGRMAQWSHMRVILISDQYLEHHGILDAIDFFFRDHETRLTSIVLITEGKAGRFLEEKPLLENTPSQQFREAQRTTSEISGKSVGANFWKLLIQLRSETGVAVVPNLLMGEQGRNNAAVSGAVVVNGERVLARLGARETEALAMLRNRYRNGVVNIACRESAEEEKTAKDILEVFEVDTKIRVEPSRAKVKFHVHVDVNGAIGELQCSDVREPDQEKEFAARAERTLERALSETISRLQKHKADALNIGNMIYADHPRLWKKMKEDWGERFAQAEAHVSVDVRINSTGMVTGKSTKMRSR